jgi:hypothetical protein
MVAKGAALECNAWNLVTERGCVVDNEVIELSVTFGVELEREVEFNLELVDGV